LPTNKPSGAALSISSRRVNIDMALRKDKLSPDGLYCVEACLFLVLPKYVPPCNQNDTASGDFPLHAYRTRIAPRLRFVD